MTTNEERREVSARLRVLAIHKTADEELVLDALGLYRGNNIEGFDTHCVMELADLIEPEPERTCRIKQHRCTNCDHEINDRAYFTKVVLDDGCWTAESRTANFCPNCCARVVEE